MISFIAIFCLNKSNSPAAGAATSTICPKPSPSLLAPFQTNGYLICQYRFYIQVDIPQTFFSITTPNQFITCIYFQRIATQTPTGKFHANFIPHGPHVPNYKLSMHCSVCHHSSIHSIHYHRNFLSLHPDWLRQPPIRYSHRLSYPCKKESTEFLHGSACPPVHLPEYSYSSHSSLQQVQKKD